MAEGFQFFSADSISLDELADVIRPMEPERIVGDYPRLTVQDRSDGSAIWLRIDEEELPISVEERGDLFLKTIGRMPVSLVGLRRTRDDTSLLLTARCASLIFAKWTGGVMFLDAIEDEFPLRNTNFAEGFLIWSGVKPSRTSRPNLLAGKG